jgi:DNA processing protein
MTSMLDRETYARAVLTYLAQPGDLVLGPLVRASGAARVVDAVRSGHLPAAPDGIDSAAVRLGLGRWRLRLPSVPSPDDVLAFSRRGIRLTCPGGPEWPAQLADLGDAQPYALWLRGNADLRSGCLRSVAVVGSRAATAYGSYMAAELAASTAAHGLTVVSGGAFGIDAAAHRGALSAGGVTIAVLASGVDVPYPAGHSELFGAIAAQGGVLVSEWPPGHHVSRLRFLHRNRLIAALTGATLVVEAAERSGAMSTALHARRLGRSLMAVPGPVTSELSAGCHQIIRDWGGALIASWGDILERMPSPPALPSPGAAADAGPAREPQADR